jgi:hypothetical protein
MRKRPNNFRLRDNSVLRSLSLPEACWGKKSTQKQSTFFQPFFPDSRQCLPLQKMRCQGCDKEKRGALAQRQHLPASRDARVGAASISRRTRPRPDAAISDTDCEASDDRTHCASYSPLVMTPAGVEWQLGRARPPSPPASAISDSSTNNLPLLPPSLASARSAAHVSARMVAVRVHWARAIVLMCL